MNKVTTINLNGRAYQLEERGFEILRKYLDTAAAKLADNPDKDEIMADFEQAIADKFDQRLSPAKNVISEKEVDEIIAAMGPVEGEGAGAEETGATNSTNPKTDSTSADGSAASSSGGAPKRLYRIPGGEWIMGVCNGLAAYFNVDVTLMRIIFILLTLISHGFMIFAYIVLAVVMPPARTEKQFAEAHGWTSRPPFNANDFIEETKKRYAVWRAELEKMHDEHKAKMAKEHGWTNGNATKNEAAGSADAAAGATAASANASASTATMKEDIHKWKHDFKKEMREKKQQMKHQMNSQWRAQQRQWHQDRWQNRRDGADYSGPGSDYPAGPGGRAYGISRAIFGFFAVIVSMVLFAVGVVWVYTLYTLIKYGNVFGYAIGAGHPLWISIAFLAAAFYVVTIPFRLILRNAWDHSGSYYYGGRSRHGGFADFGRFIVFVAVCAVLIYTARELFPQVNTAWESGMNWLKMKI